MKLMYAAPSPFARKVRAAAIELDLDEEIELVTTAVAPGKANPDYASAYNPLRKIPALALDDGMVLYDSTVICEYLDERAGGGRIIPAEGPERWSVMTQHSLANGMCEAGVLIRYETFVRPEAARWDGWIEDQWDRIWSGLNWFERSPDRLSGSMNLAQIALGCLLGYLDFRYADAGWRDRCPNLARWYEENASRDCLAQTVPVDAAPAPSRR